MRKKLSLKERLKRLSLEGPKEDKPKLILKAKKINGVGRSETDRTVSKEREPDIEHSPTKKIGPKTIKNFEVLSGEVKGISGLTAVCDESGMERLSQILYLKDTPGVELRWTVIRDPSAEEFAMVIREGLRQIKTQPLIFGTELDDGVILASHRKEYTITLACYDLKIGEIVQIFISLLGYVKKQMHT